MQGFNKYYPPDYEPDKHKSLNSYHGKHALGDRARKIDQGILVVRFELPYNIWCNHCSSHVGQGVRYNAEKKKVGSYYTTPIYSFRFKCHLCQGRIEIRTDPQNTRYVVTEGARQKNEEAEDPEADGMLVVDSTASTSTAPPDAFASLEKTVTQKARAESASARLSALEAQSATHWADPFSASLTLRRAFKKRKRVEVDSERRAEGVAERYGLAEERVGREALRTPREGSAERREEDERWEEVRRARERAKWERERGEREGKAGGVGWAAGGKGKETATATDGSRRDKNRRETSKQPRSSTPRSPSSASLPRSASSSALTSSSSAAPSSAARALHSKLALASRLKRDPFALSSPSGVAKAGGQGMGKSASAPAGLSGLALGGGGAGGVGVKRRREG
ncbi:hypothetical protein JCM10207_001430 [Rhodosporidiobolus poonsookiae]